MATPQGYTVVAGAAGGIGRAVARRLAPNGPLALLDRDQVTLDELAASVRTDAAGEVVGVGLDLADGRLVGDCFERLAAERGVTSLAVTVGTTTGGSLTSLTDQSWDAILDSCLRTVMNVMRAAVTVMRDGGSICVLGSVHAHQPVPGFPAYGAAKAAVTALARQVAAEYGSRGIRVNVVTPGWTRTPHTEARLDPTDERRLREATALGSLVEPDDVAAAVAFLLSPAAARVTGAEVVVDAGASLLPAASVLRDGHRHTLGLPPL
ncbi:SDR family NAD(P)-dependent oxidoreductase [Jiangella alba]|uniref:Enoyl-(Acyl carrier protein) reductase n=1 Tax=Jiangella alba TaxID=561176 RepID=A0A1H5JGC1_9ACTN|nr:SDR family oxidoreductase [Jiangella alba]SEE51499.1 Enoyl-(Acyl carrier protein) reductase [Jiangella alba]